MRGITSKLFVLALITITGLFILTSCEHSKGSLRSNQPPSIQITSYNGAVDSSNVYSDTLLYQQTIYWEGVDTDGIIAGYAFRILDNDGNAVGTYNYETLDGEGWVYHYKEGANESDPNHPLGDPEVSTIWTSRPSATIRFPASISQQIIRDSLPDGSYIETIINESATGIPYLFEVKALDNRDAQSSIVGKYFFTYSVKPETYISTTKGELSYIDEDTEQIVYKDVGLGVRFSFSMVDEDPYIANDPKEFKYVLYKVDTDGNFVQDDNYKWTELPDTTDLDEWYIAYDSGNISRQILTADPFNTPPLVDFNDDNYLTRIACIGIDEAGLPSYMAYKDFRVKEGFYPGTLVYNYDIFALGDNHFVDYRDFSLGIVIPSRTTLTGIEYSTPLFIDQHSRLVALHSDDLQIHMYWGFNGEFSNNSPREKKEDVVLDEQTGVNYLSEIRFFDFRLNGEPYRLPAFGDPSQYVVTDNDGTQWSRFYISSEYAKRVTLVNLEPTDPFDINSYHKFEVRAVDLQNEPDPTPAEFSFKLDAPLSYEEKQGILIIDDEIDHAFSPQDTVYAFYNDYIAGYTPNEVLDYKYLEESVWDSQLHFSKDVLSPTDLQKYKLVIWHVENPPKNIKNNFAKEYDVLNLYLRSGGNIILVGGANLSNVYDAIVSEAYPIFEDYFGLSASVNDVSAGIRFLPGPLTQEPYFIGAEPTNSDWPQVMVNLEGNWSAIGPIISARGGIGSVSYFNNGNFISGVEVLYKTIIKDPSAEVYPPSAEQYAAYNERPNVLRFKREVAGQVGVQQTCYLVGFPLIYMDQAATQEMMGKMIEDVMTQND